jgi:uncharacterized protein (TIGR00251 family)
LAYYSIRENIIFINIKVTPGMRENKIVGIKNEELIVHIKAQAEKDKANKELARFFSKELGISRTDIEIRSGMKSHHKVVVLPKSVINKLPKTEEK